MKEKKRILSKSARNIDGQAVTTPLREAADRDHVTGLCRELALMEVGAIISEKLRTLMALGEDGEGNAFQIMVVAAEEAIDLVEQFRSKYPEVAKGIAAKRVSWPAIITSDERFPDLRAVRRQLGIGSARVLGFNTEVRPDYKSTTVCRELTIVCILTIQTLSVLRETQDRIRANKRLRTEFDYISQQLKTAEDEEIGKLGESFSLFERQVHNESGKQFEAFTLILKKLTKLLGIAKLSKEIVSSAGKALRPVNSETYRTLAPESVNEWRETIVNLLEHVLPNGLHANAALYDVGKYRALKYFRDNHNLSPSEAEKELERGRASKTVASNVRDGIRTRIHDTLEELVKPPLR